MSRNQFESNEESITEPHVELPPLADGYHYSLKKTADGRSIVTVEEDEPETPERRYVVNDQNPDFYDEFGRHRIG